MVYIYSTPEIGDEEVGDSLHALVATDDNDDEHVTHDGDDRHGAVK
jgi:hypothetical protein